MDRSQLSNREVADRFIEVFYRQNRLVEAFREWVHPGLHPARSQLRDRA